MKKELKITKEITPREMMCSSCDSCPAIFETNQDSYIVIGKIRDAEKLGISTRVGKDEKVIEIPKKLLNKR